MEIGRAPMSLPPTGREEISQRLKSGRSDIGGDPAAAERRAAPVQTTQAVDRTARPDMTEPSRDSTALSYYQERGTRLDLRV